MSSFKDLRIVDNFYQTSLFFPMPTVLISTIAADGSTSLAKIQNRHAASFITYSRQIR